MNETEQIFKSWSEEFKNKIKEEGHDFLIKEYKEIISDLKKLEKDKDGYYIHDYDHRIEVRDALDVILKNQFDFDLYKSVIEIDNELQLLILKNPKNKNINKEIFNENEWWNKYYPECVK
ncbi:hypothetical protein CSB11_00730 [Candidatus Campbellbacteria bacterium]|nr:MAG: hypothetical protein CSB11_00730 [Candidatus Campbellbacteria bacterium]